MPREALQRLEDAYSQPECGIQEVFSTLNSFSVGVLDFCESLQTWPIGGGAVRHIPLGTECEK
jgi:hypothetical protein